MNLLLSIFNRYKIYILTSLCSCLLASIAISSGLMLSEQARSANEFVDSIGVAVHLNRLGTGYRKYDAIIRPRLQELGIRHIRNGVKLEDVSTQQKFLDLAQIGIKSTLVMEPRNVYTSSRAVKLAKSLLESIEAVEGPNEWDNKPELEYAGKNFPQGLRQFQAELYSAIKADPVTAHLPVLAPSFVDPKRAAKLGPVACDMGNIHHYPKGKPLWSDLLQRLLSTSKIICDNKPIIVTESGYSTSIYDPNRYNYDSLFEQVAAKVARENKYAVSEQVSAKYLLRLFLEYFNQGFKRFYAYELIDFYPSPMKKAHYGLLRNDGSPKPDFIALKNLISLLQESEAAEATFTKSPSFRLLNYGLQGDRANIHHTLLQKSNGNFYLILWQEVPSFDHKTKTDIVVPDRLLTLTLNTPISKATIYQPVNSINSLEQYDNIKQLKLKVPDHPLLIKLVPV